MHGVLSYNEANMSSGSIVTDDDIRRGRLSYRHDDTETRHDNFTFIVHVRSLRNAVNVSGLQDVMFTIDVRPVNDQNFVLHSGMYVFFASYLFLCTFIYY